MNDKIKIMRCPLCLSLQIETSPNSVATGMGVVEKQEVRCLDCGACHIAETTEEAINGWNAYASKSEYPAELTGHPLLQRWDDGRGYDNYCEQAVDGEYVRYGDHCFRLRSLQTEVDLLRSLAEPVPPAGVEVEVVYWVADHISGIDCYGNLYSTAGMQGCRELVDRAHVTRLQAEVGEWKEARNDLIRGNDALHSQIADLQAEMTKARNALLKIVHASEWTRDDAHYAAEAQTIAVDATSNQSAPADNGQVNPEHTLFNEIRISEPVKEDGEPVACAHGIRAPHACDPCEAKNAVPDYWEDPDTGTCIDQWSKIQGLNGTEAYSIPLYRHAEQPAPVAVVMPEKYDDVLLPFLSLMRAELHANAHKGDRPGWLQMDRKTAVLEVFYHMGKLHQAVHRDEAEAIKEYAADVANMCMMLTDVCGYLNSEPKP